MTPKRYTAEAKQHAGRIDAIRSASGLIEADVARVPAGKIDEFDVQGHFAWLNQPCALTTRARNLTTNGRVDSFSWVASAKERSVLQGGKRAWQLGFRRRSVRRSLSHA